MTIDRVIVTVALVGCVWLFSTAGIWGPIVDNLECGAPKVPAKVRL